MSKISENTIIILAVLFSICFVTLLFFLNQNRNEVTKDVLTLTPTVALTETVDPINNYDLAIKLVQNLPEVINYIKTVPNTVVEYDHDTDDKSAWVIHVYENREDHLATFNWYDVDKTSGKITKEFDF